MLLDGGTSPFPASVSRRSFGTFSHEALTSIGVISGKFLFIGVDQGISKAYIASLICGKEGEVPF